MSDRNVHHRPSRDSRSKHRTGTDCWCNPVVEIILSKAEQEEKKRQEAVLQARVYAEAFFAYPDDIIKTVFDMDRSLLVRLRVAADRNLKSRLVGL